MRKLLLLILITLSALFSATAQQEAQYSMYRFNGLYLNPGYTGSHDVLSAMAIYRHQWVKVPGQPQTASVALHSPLPNQHLALGVIYTFDKIGVTKTNTLEANFAYRLFLGKKKDIKLSFGISAGFTNYRADLDQVQTTEANDPNFIGNNQRRWLPNVGFGIYAYSDRFFAGISLPKLLLNRLDGKMKLYETSSAVSRQYYHLVATAGYVFNIGTKVKFMPSVMLKYVPVNAPVTADFNATFIFIDRVWLGAAYRLLDSYNFMAAFAVTKQLRIGYCYDLTVSRMNKYTSGSHEVMVSFDAAFERSKVTSPRYIKYF